MYPYPRVSLPLLLRRYVDLDKSGFVDTAEWIAYITAQAAKSERAAKKLLQVYAKQIGDDKRVIAPQSGAAAGYVLPDAIKAEAERVFALADKDSSVSHCLSSSMP